MLLSVHPPVRALASAIPWPCKRFGIVFDGGRKRIAARQHETAACESGSPLGPNSSVLHEDHGGLQQRLSILAAFGVHRVADGGEFADLHVLAAVVLGQMALLGHFAV